MVNDNDLVNQFYQSQGHSIYGGNYKIDKYSVMNG